MKVRSVCLEAADAVEVSELLEFLGQWLACDGGCLVSSFDRFVSSGGGYDIDELRADLLRFALLLGGIDGEELIGGDAG